MGLFVRLSYKKPYEITGLKSIYAEYQNQAVEFDLLTGFLSTQFLVTETAKNQYQNIHTAEERYAWEKFFARKGRRLMENEINGIEKKLLPLLNQLPMGPLTDHTVKIGDSDSAFLTLTEKDGKEKYYTNAYRKRRETIVRYQPIPPAFMEVFHFLCAEAAEPGSLLKNTQEKRVPESTANTFGEISEAELDELLLDRSCLILRKRAVSRSGRCGLEIRYNHEQRTVLWSSWGTNRDKREEWFDLPEGVYTRGELKKYIQEHYPHWLGIEE